MITLCISLSGSVGTTLPHSPPEQLLLPPATYCSSSVPPKMVSGPGKDLPGVLMTNRAKLPLVPCQHRCAGVMGPLHPHGQRGLQDRGEVSP